MLDCNIFYNILVQQGIKFFTGVPDSILKGFCAYLTNHNDSEHIIAANEGGAIALATGYHLATGEIPLIYMQNSGLGNAINPLVSLVDASVYSIPMLLLIGWRGEPKTKDEPQHNKQGGITLELLDVLNIPYRILPNDNENAEHYIKESIGLVELQNKPVALIVKKDTFKPYILRTNKCFCSKLNREDAIKTVVNHLSSSDNIISTTGKISRELYACDGSWERHFLNVGAMGHTSQIALGIAKSKPEKQVYCFDGDGAVIMHMGALGIIGSSKTKNFKHIIFNNGCHDSVGGMDTCGFSISFTNIARACGYSLALQAKSIDEINKKMQLIKLIDGPAMLEIIVKQGARDDLERPKQSPINNKIKFMKHLRTIK